jgi:hypothetical protein
MPTNVCPRCGTENDSVSGTRRGEVMPDPGDISMCLRCGHLMAFTRGLRLRELTKAERRKAGSDRWTSFVEAQRQTVMKKAKH